MIRRALLDPSSLDCLRNSRGTLRVFAIGRGSHCAAVSPLSPIIDRVGSMSNTKFRSAQPTRQWVTMAEMHRRQRQQQQQQQQQQQPQQQGIARLMPRSAAPLTPSMPRSPRSRSRGRRTRRRSSRPPWERWLERRRTPGESCEEEPLDHHGDHGCLAAWDIPL